MSKKKLNNPFGGLVYSTDPDFKPADDHDDEQETIAPQLQKLRVRLETKHRAGKVVTLVEGFNGKVADEEELGRQLKSHCGTGGSVKDHEIIIQGDHRDKVLHWLLKKGYTGSKKV